ncbi:hypothetical protein DO97_12300 [Neosynechococcus sphagnicola sy1]|uniref:Uncharacterized protein n=1 Tax=Neosynechococcus sphagnicola sy1 TaxID=1497020 RepID=A0A098TJV0_9CYAN|nr:hypothetical protein [Neosynechococcus sphagnicola]KGF72117.1 hypothetical protein DO97_12300 [Neosynechococcus sphagnicola sy1]
MFLDELSPIMQGLVQQPVAFLGGFCAGVLRLNLEEDPIKSWLDQQIGGVSPSPTETQNGQNPKAKGPQTISID